MDDGTHTSPATPAMRAIGQALAGHAKQVVAPTPRPRMMYRAMPGVAAPQAPRQPDFLPFVTGKLGAFPFQWENPRTLKFSATTYDWIRASVQVVNGSVIQKSGFPLDYILAMTAVEVRRSKADTAALAQAAANTEQKATVFAIAWQSTYGTFPPGDPVIDALIGEITTNWASPQTSLQALLAAPDISVMLNQTPPSGLPLLADLALYLDAARSQIALLTLGTFDTGRLDAAREAVNTPCAANGAVELDNGLWRPAFYIDKSSSTIASELAALGVARTQFSGAVDATASTTTLQFDNAPPVPLDPAALSIRVNGQDVLAQTKGKAALLAEFGDVVSVHFGPRAFAAPGTGWFWARPLIDGLANINADVTGFVLVSDQALNILTSGAFGFLTGVAISGHPVLHLSPGAVPNLSPAGSADVMFGGQCYSTTYTNDATNGLVLTPTRQIGSASGSSRAFVHAVQPCFPVA